MLSKSSKSEQIVFSSFPSSINASGPSDSFLLYAATYHTVVKGDTLWGLSRKYGVTLNDIVTLNGIKVASIILVGEKIRIE